MLSGCTLFDSDVSTLDYTSVKFATDFLLLSGFTQTNYDPLLAALAAVVGLLQTGVPFHAGTAQFGAGTPATDRANIISTASWVITDGGQAP